MHVLAICYGGAHVNTLAPVVTELRQRGVTVTFYGLTLAGPVLTTQSIPHEGFRSLVTPEDEDALEVGRGLASRWHDREGGIALAESIAYLGLSYADLVARIGPDEATRRVDALGRQAFLPLGPLRRAFDRHRPDVVCATNAPRAEQAAMLVAAERGIPRVIVNDLFGMRLPYRLEAERICVISEFVRRSLVTAGTDAQCLRVTGNPLCDAIARQLEHSHGTVDLGLPSGRKVLMADQTAHWTDQGLHHDDDSESRAALTAFRDSCRALAAVPLVRRHPTRHRAWMHDFVGVHWVDDVPLYPLLQNSNVVFTRSSTVGLEAALLGRPVVTLHPYETPNPLLLAEIGMAVNARTVDEVRTAISRLLNDEDARNELGRTRASTLQSDFRLDGLAAKRVADIVVELGSPRRRGEVV